MKYRIKELVKNVLLICKIDVLLGIINRHPRVVFWHSVDNSVNQKIEPDVFPISLFEKQINYLDEKYEIISVEEFYLRHREKKFKGKEVVITFDDGFSSNLHIVAPILLAKKIPFAVFISTENIESGELYPTSIPRVIIYDGSLDEISVPSLGLNSVSIREEDEKDYICDYICSKLRTLEYTQVRQIIKELKANISPDYYKLISLKYRGLMPMSWDEVIQLHEKGVTIGSHCDFHICCHKGQNEEEVYAQMFTSKKIIESKIKTKCEYFAYPNGDYTPLFNSFVKKCGYKLGFIIDSGVKIKYNSIIIPRICIPRAFNTFKFLVNLLPKR